MSQTLEPRNVSPDAWRRWWRAGLQLARRSAPTVLPLVVVMALCVGALSTRFWGVGIFFLVAFSGIWQAVLLSLFEQSARGRRLDLGMAWQAAEDYWRLPSRVAQRQVMIRLAFGLGGLAFVFIVAFVLLASGAVDPPKEPAPARPDPTTWSMAYAMLRDWSLMFIWAWVMQVGSTVSMANYLVRNHSLSWLAAHELNLRARRKNIAISTLSVSFLGIMAVVFVFPPIVLVLEVIWSAVMTCAARDLFEQKEALEPQDVRVSNVVPALQV